MKKGVSQAIKDRQQRESSCRHEMYPQPPAFIGGQTVLRCRRCQKEIPVKEK